MENEVVVIHPASENEVARVPVTPPEALEEMVINARTAQYDWQCIGFDGRLRLLKRLKKYIKKHYEEEFVRGAIQLETGKTWPDAMVDVASAAAEIYYLERDFADKIRGREENSYLGESVRPHPLLAHEEVESAEGLDLFPDTQVVGVISPWNLPLAIPAADIFPALFDGCAVIWKPSEYTPLTAYKLKEAMKSVGFPDNVLQIVIGRGEIGAALCEKADYISFTGSCRTGEKVEEICKRRGIPYNLEMGGKAPAIVLPDANIERAAYALVYGALANSGQYCKSFERIYVHKKIFHEVFSRVIQIIWYDLEPGKDYGPMITRFQLETVEKQIKDAEGKGAKVYWHKELPESLRGRGNWFAPTILYPANHTMAVMKEETFGPVMPFMEFDDVEEAISLANDSHLGLNASVFTQDKKMFYRIARRLKIGNILANNAMINWFMPVEQCGYRGSATQPTGLHRHGRSGVRRFLKEKSIDWHKHPFFYLPLFKNKEPWWLPYNSLTNLALKYFLRKF